MSSAVTIGKARSHGFSRALELLAQAAEETSNLHLLNLESMLMIKPKKKYRSMVGIVKARMKAHEGCESTSVETRQSKRTATRREKLASVTNQYNQIPRHHRRGMVLLPSRPKNRLKGPRGLRAAKQVAAKRVAAGA